jgi:hypothetical protein
MCYIYRKVKRVIAWLGGVGGGGGEAAVDFLDLLREEPERIFHQAKRVLSCFQ